MEKLRQLLNDYEDYKEKETWYSNYDWRLNEINDEEEYEQWITAFRVDDSQLWVEESIAVIICRWYCFIEWLVENDKVDRDKFQERKSDYNAYFTWELTKEEKSELVISADILTMLLSIQDDPISFLISILK